MNERQSDRSPQTGDLRLREKREVAQQEERTRAELTFEPAVDIFENEDSLTLVADMPGVPADAIEIDLRDPLITLSGQARPVDKRWRQLYGEYRIGNYWRQFRLGQQIDQSKITAQVTDGVLTLTLPKAESALPRRIEVQTAR